MHACMYVLCMYVCVCVYIYIYIYVSEPRVWTILATDGDAAEETTSTCPCSGALFGRRLFEDASMRPWSIQSLGGSCLGIKFE